MPDYPANPGPLPLFKLRNMTNPQFPIDPAFTKERKETGQQVQADAENESPEGPLAFEDKRTELVKQLQLMLKEDGFEIGSATNPDGVDGKFGDLTRSAVREFQERNKDAEGNPLKIDGEVGPLTADALNRRMVGQWYDQYDSPKEITSGVAFVTVTPERLSEGITLCITGDGKENTESVGVRRRRTDSRVAFENIPSTIRARAGIQIQILDEELNTVGPNIKFEENRSKERMTDDEGFIVVSQDKPFLTMLGDSAATGSERDERALIVVGGICQESEQVFALLDDGRLIDKETSEEVDFAVASKSRLSGDSQIA
jgi:peptidoglycan hydrolase-like protein with peptidoglycan-binding domain